MKTLSLLALMTTLATATAADSKVGFTPDDTAATVLTRQVGQRVELQLRSGQKIAGKIEGVGKTAVHVSAVTGQEFFDAVVILEDISAVLIRTK